MKKYILIFIIISYLSWQFIFKKPVYQQLYGYKSDITYQGQALYLDIQGLSEQQEIQQANLGGYDIEYTLKAYLQGWVRVAYVDIYDNNFHIGKKTFQVQAHDLYNKVSPLDLSLMIGKTAEDGNWQKISVKHEYRVVSWNYEYKNPPFFRIEDVSNFHILPATLSIRRGMDTIRQGDIIFIKGYLLDWKGTGKFDDVKFTTALYEGQTSDQKYGGNKLSFKCFYLYVTDLIVNGYAFNTSVE